MVLQDSLGRSFLFLSCTLSAVLVLGLAAIAIAVFQPHGFPFILSPWMAKGQGVLLGSSQRSPPLCKDGLSPGQWQRDEYGKQVWVAKYCVYHNYNKTEAQQCLNGKHIYILGDSTSRHLFNGFQTLFGCSQDTENRTTRYDAEFTCELASGSISYLFRGKVMHQRAPREGMLPDDDVHNNIIKKWGQLSLFPDIVIMSIGPHEALAWTGRPQPSLNITELQADTDEFQEFFFDKLKFPGRFIWWKAHYLQPKRLVGDDYARTRVYYDDATTYMMKSFGARGADLADFFQTTWGQPTDNTGVHYTQLAGFHANIMLNIICN